MTNAVMAGAALPTRVVTRAVAGLLLNALVWGTSWWPFRRLQSVGLHPLWATACIYLVAVGVIVTLRPTAPMQLVRAPALWLLLVASGITNAAFNWASVIGDVVRVVLLFYLCPVWTVLLARLLLGEGIGMAALARVGLALLGAVLLLWPGLGDVRVAAGPPWLPDALSLVGGFTFALTNVLLRREGRDDTGLPLDHTGRDGRPSSLSADDIDDIDDINDSDDIDHIDGSVGSVARRPAARARSPATSPAARALAMFAGGLLVSTSLATGLARHGALPWPSPPAAWWMLALGLAGLFLCGNLALQYGAARLPANVTSVVMLSEVLFAATSAWWWNAAAPSVGAMLGGGCIVAAAALAAVGARAAVGGPTVPSP